MFYKELWPWDQVSKSNKYLTRDKVIFETGRSHITCWSIKYHKKYYNNQQMNNITMNYTSGVSTLTGMNLALVKLVFSVL